MVDYGKYGVRKFTVKISGKVLELKAPKIRQVEEINKFSGKFLTKGTSTDEMIDIAILILNRNDNGAQFNKEFVEELEYDIVYKLIYDYIMWVNEIHTNPN